MTARLVAVGRKFPEYATKHFTYAIEDPAWSPQKSGELVEPDPSDYRKQQIEDRLAEDDLL